jgi:hypothetical protein
MKRMRSGGSTQGEGHGHAPKARRTPTAELLRPRGFGWPRDHRTFARTSHRRPVRTPEQPVKRSHTRAWLSMAIHSQDGQRHACGASADRLAVKEGIEARLLTCSDMPSSKSCPCHAAWRSPRTAGQLWEYCDSCDTNQTRITHGRVEGLATIAKEERVCARLPGCVTITSGSRRRLFKRLSPINSCRSTGTAEAKLPDHCNSLDEWPPRSAHGMA